MTYLAEMSMDRTGSDWIRTEANFGWIRTGSDCTFFKIGRPVLDRTEKIFVSINVIILKISKILVVIRFHKFAKW